MWPLGAERGPQYTTGRSGTSPSQNGWELQTAFVCLRAVKSLIFTDPWGRQTKCLRYESRVTGRLSAGEAKPALLWLSGVPGLWFWWSDMEEDMWAGCSFHASRIYFVCISFWYIYNVKRSPILQYKERERQKASWNKETFVVFWELLHFQTNCSVILSRGNAAEQETARYLKFVSWWRPERLQNSCCWVCVDCISALLIQDVLWAKPSFITGT